MIFLFGAEFTHELDCGDREQPALRTDEALNPASSIR